MPFTRRNNRTIQRDIMIILPAIDIKDGRCVRITQARMDAESVYSNDPTEVAKRW
mgnify:FL=1